MNDFTSSNLYIVCLHSYDSPVTFHGMKRIAFLNICGSNQCTLSTLKVCCIVVSQACSAF
jgi:hypothetical protein